MAVTYLSQAFSFMPFGNMKQIGHHEESHSLTHDDFPRAPKGMDILLIMLDCFFLLTLSFER